MASVITDTSARLLGRETVAEGTMAFHFERPSGFVHQAGQNALFRLGGESRTFSIASAPHEPHLTIATRMRDSAFKRSLKTAAPGLEVEIDGPAGLMVMHEDAARPAVFLAGGIGITPFLAMVRDAAHRKLPHHIVLFYANRQPRDAAFLDELRGLEQRNPHYRLVATMSAPPGDWRGETGFIRRDMLERHLPDLRTPVYYFAGPPAMAMAMQEMLSGLGIAESEIRSEEFYGY
jgi:ferredoxin-NADP reductase